MSRINYPAVKKYKRRDRSIHPSIHRAFETAAPMYVTYVGPGDKSRGSFAPRKGLLRCVGIAQFVSGSRGERGIEGRRRGEESVPRDVNFSTGEKRKICGNTELYPTLFLPRYFSCTRACVKSCVGFEKEVALGLTDPLAARIFLRERTMPVDKRSKLCTKEIGRSDSRGRYPVEHIRCNSISRERETGSRV